ncbi:MAG: peptidase S41 [Flavobacterium sp.]|nr:peptidase S41 [Flavobacterium sp.]
MKSKIKYILVLFLALLSFQSCEDKDDFPEKSEVEVINENDSIEIVNVDVQDFIWKGLNLYYLWQADVPNLADDRFANQKELNQFLSKYPVPEDLFNALRVYESIDKFSWIEDDYEKLEGQLQGNTNSNGVEFGLNLKSTGSQEVIGWVRYIVPNSDASTKNIKRGDIFYAVNGITLTVDNYSELLFGSENNYKLNFADYSNGTFVPNGKSVDLTKTPLEENPILINKVIVSGSHKIGYLMYNGFYSNYDSELNDAFGALKSQGITDLVLDLRYNGGGSVLTATRLASMITGSFTGQVFAKQQWNSKVESYFESNNPDALKNFFTNKIGSTPINSVNMSKVYILTTRGSASASELVINGLKPFINVVQIGDVTIGKNVGSITLYDSPTFDKENRNPNHRYAMQPIVLKIVNALGFGDYQNGLVPNFQQKEAIATNLGVLGSTSEPLLSTAIAKITGVTARLKPQTAGVEFKSVSNSKSIHEFQNQMYLEKVPEGLSKLLK